MNSPSTYFFCPQKSGPSTPQPVVFFFFSFNGVMALSLPCKVDLVLT